MNDFLERMVSIAKEYCPVWVIAALKKAIRESEKERRFEDKREMSFLERQLLKDISKDDIEALPELELFQLSRELDQAGGLEDVKKALDIRKYVLFEKAKWTTAYINTLSDSAFLHVESGGEKDGEGKTVPRTLRHLPYRDSKGKVDLPHLRNALARLSQTKLSRETQGKIRTRAQRILEEQKEKTQKEIVFVQKGLSPLEKARGEFLVGGNGEVFEKKYLEPLNISKDDIVFCITKEFNSFRYPNAVIVALGRQAATELGGYEDIILPHPEAVRKYGDSGEVGRKLLRIKNLIDIRRNRFYDECNGLIHKSDQNDAEFVGVKINKSIEEKRIVYGVVMDPYGKNGPQADAHNDWTPPAEIEKTAHQYVKGSRSIKLQHQNESNARVVESWVEQYPSPQDYRKAMQGKDHNVWRRPFGDDIIHSGSWLMGVELNEGEWSSFKKGEFNAFSPGGMGMRKPMESSEMPTVEFLDLK